MPDLQTLFTETPIWLQAMRVLLIAALVLLPVLLLTAIYTWMERRQAALMQDRIGPTRANLSLGGRSFTFWGLLHIAADGLKFVFKEDVVPRKVHPLLFGLAPVLALAPVVIAFSVLPFGSGFIYDRWDQIVTDSELAVAMETGTALRLQGANLEIGLLVVFAFSGLGVFGASLAGFGSYNKWALLGGLRAAAQMISYEVTLGLTVVGALIIYGTLEPMAIVQAQGASIWSWGIVVQPVGLVLFLTAAIAESKRIPFDIPEGESEIMGFNVEYSGMRWGIFFLGEFMELVFVGAMVTTVFLGGWNVPGLRADGFFLGGLEIPLPHLGVVVLGVTAFWLKVVLVGFLQIAIRWTLPRLRYDQLMRLGWQGMLPLSLANVIITAVVVLAVRS
ncbi:MAG: NADH-quinone oxidoreductase subunit H [Polyangia bacterium]|jgi:NADH-quinone oxidoreductase subunit H|nr:NADH-quinone oxidoreductase subunit H [Polyangia bacterium]